MLNDNNKTVSIYTTVLLLSAGSSHNKSELERKVHELESENLRLRDSVREERQRNTLLEEQLEQAKSSQM